MTKIKICGLFRPCDIDFINEAKPDYCGFIINYPKSHRNVTPSQVGALVKNLSPDIQPVGVFVDQPLDVAAALANAGTIRLIQLHGQEDESYIHALRQRTDAPIIKAFRITCPEDVLLAEKSSADHILLDSGCGTGEPFRWEILTGIQRPYILAGGLTPENISLAIASLHPYAIDLSSGVETDRRKDRDKILAAVAAARTL